MRIGVYALACLPKHAEASTPARTIITPHHIEFLVMARVLLKTIGRKGLTNASCRAGLR